MQWSITHDGMGSGQWLLLMKVMSLVDYTT